MEPWRVLVIDDSTTLRKVVEIAMRGTGCEVALAVNGCDGVALARTSRPDVILLDYLLPDLRSVDVCQRLRDDASTAAVPIVIMSANHRGVLDDFRQFSTVVGFIGKPFTAPEIRARLEAAVRRPPGMASASASTDRSASRTRSDPADPPDGELRLGGDLAVTPLLEVLRLLAATHATGVLAIAERPVALDGGAVARISLRRGEILLCATTGTASLDAALTPELRDRVIRNLTIGKPALVTLAEAGASRAANLPLELHAASARLIADLLDARSGRFTWEPAVVLPEFVEAFGRHVSLTALALDQARRAAGAAMPEGGLDRIYDRTARFSRKLAGAQLDGTEQRVLALIDGRTCARDIATRAGMPPDRVAATLSRLSAADLISHAEPSQASATRTLAVLDADRDGVIAPLRVGLGRRAQPIDVIELDPARPVAAATLASRADIVLIGVAALTRHVIEHEIPILARDGNIAVVCLLDAPNAALASQILQAGVHAVLAKPVHLQEIERLLSVTRTQEPPCPPFSS